MRQRAGRRLRDAELLAVYRRASASTITRPSGRSSPRTGRGPRPKEETRARCRPASTTRTRSDGAVPDEQGEHRRRDGALRGHRAQLRPPALERRRIRSPRRIACSSACDSSRSAWRSARWCPRRTAAIARCVACTIATRRWRSRCTATATASPRVKLDGAHVARAEAVALAHGGAHRRDHDEREAGRRRRRTSSRTASRRRLRTHRWKGKTLRGTRSRVPCATSCTAMGVPSRGPRARASASRARDGLDDYQVLADERCGRRVLPQRARTRRA